MIRTFPARMTVRRITGLAGAALGAMTITATASAGAQTTSAVESLSRSTARAHGDSMLFPIVPVPAPAVETLEWIPFVAPNGEHEHYLRQLQVAGMVRQYPWSLRGFSPQESRRLSAARGSHPWSGARAFSHRQQELSFGSMTTTMWYNASFPYGSNDGPVWAGRGVTTSIEGSLLAIKGPVSLVLAPMAFRAQNAEFTTVQTGLSGNLAFADAQFPTTIDRPQRFGDGGYGRADPGNTTLRLDISGLTAGVSTANMVWGPFDHYPFLLGTNAPGFAHGFVGTSKPLNLWITRIHGRVMWGRLEQSPYSSVQGEPTFISILEPGTRRFASGLVAILEPRGMAGLELGVARFFHSFWLKTGIPPSYFRKPFQGFLKGSLPEDTPGFAHDPQTGTDNQLASVFARWVLPAARIEVYGEYGREDHSWDKRDFLQEPDHTRSYGLGLRHVLRAHPNRLDGFGIELINFQLPPLVRTGRGEGSIYLHGRLRQGHTNRGQILGADVGVNSAAGLTVRWDRYVPSGRTSVALHRVVRMDRGSFFAGGAVDERANDVQYALQGERFRHVGRAEITLGTTIIRELNRNFADHAWSLALTAKAGVPLSRSP